MKLRSLTNGALLAFALAGIASCGGSDSTQAVISLVAERDSLRHENEASRKKLELVTDMIETINLALDSISEQENLLFIYPRSEGTVTRDDALKNLARYERVLKHQQEKIAQLQSESRINEGVQDMSGMIAMLQQQLNVKNKQIQQLKEELNKKDVDINKLRIQVANQKTQIDEQTQTIANLGNVNKAQGEALVRQDEIINTGYVIVGTKKDLERRGFIKKNRLIPESALDKSKFAKVDMRKYKEVTFMAKRPKILTDMPQSSYSLTTDGGGNFTLHIKNPADFWRISSYLIIQTD